MPVIKNTQHPFPICDEQKQRLFLKDYKKQSFWKQIYERYRNPFIIRAMNRFHCSKEVAQDAFQEVVVATYLNIANKKLEKLDVPIKFYLYRIGDNKLITNLEREKLAKNVIETFCRTNLEPTPVEIEENVYLKRLLQQAFEQLDKRSAQLLTLYYLENNCLEAIANKMGYKNKRVVQSRKVGCLKKLKQVLGNNKARYKPATC